MRSVLLTVAALSGLACSKPASSADQPPPGASAPARPTAVAAAAAPRAETGEYLVELRPAPLVVGQPGHVEVVVQAKGKLHVNAEYPRAFVTANTAGVRYAQARVALTEVLASTPCPQTPSDLCEVRAKLPLVPEQAEVAVEGVFAFSVCDAEHCLIEKVPLKLSLVAAAAN